MRHALLELRELRTYFEGEGGAVRAVDGVSFALDRDETLGVVGESGSGKSVMALSVMGLIPRPAGRIAGGEVLFDGVDLLKLDNAALSERRGDALAMIFQEPMTALNPAFTIGDQIAESLARHRAMGKRQAHAAAVAMLERVRIPAAERRAGDYPHQLSGGMRQRAMIAMALACGPKLVIADEPTTALDVTIQAQILDLLRELRAETGMAMMLISHDLGVIAELADRVIVMYAGKIVEQASVTSLFEAPQHPYTIGLLGAIPRLDGDAARLANIGGAVPNPAALPSGCRFHPRCPFAIEECRAREPALREIRPGQLAACWRAPLDESTA